MIHPKLFTDILLKQGISFFTGVPDSLLKEFCAYIMDQLSPSQHIITANEGGAIGLAAGYHLATGKVPLVYLQNSGLGNTVNPLLSLADKEVYGIPMLLLIGWRGEPGIKDEPQHIKQGRVQEAILNALEIPFRVIDSETNDVEQVISAMVKKAVDISNPVAIVVRNGTFDSHKYKPQLPEFEMSREKAISIILSSLSERDAVVSTTGKASREVFEYRAGKSEGHSRDFLTVGSMGHSAMIAMGIAMSKPDRKVICLDGDGALLMHLGAMAIIGSIETNNLVHILLNNGTHESVGGQPTTGFKVDFCGIAKAVGYKWVKSVQTESDLNLILKELPQCAGNVFIEVKTNNLSRSNLGRPTSTPAHNKEQLMKFLREK